MSGVYPANHTDMASSVVPVLPAVGLRSASCAGWPVPWVITVDRT